MAVEQFERELGQLGNLSTEALAHSLDGVIANERQHVVFVIAHLAVLRERKGHLELGYQSLFEYCEEHLKLSKGTVWNRLQVAGVARRFPVVLDELFCGLISLTVAGQLAPHLTEENVGELMARSRGKTKAEVAEILVEFAPKPAVRPGVSRARGSADRERDSTNGAVEILSSSERGATTQAAPAPPPRGRLEPAEPEVFNFRFAGSGELKGKLERFAEVVGVADPRRNMAEVLEKALDIALEHRDPKQRAERREERAEKHRAKRAEKHRAERAEKHQKKEAQEQPEKRTEETQISAGGRTQGLPAGPRTRVPRALATRKRSRHIPAALRDEVLERASHRCEFRARDGRRCRARTALQVDHRQPYACAGAHSSENLRALCPQHNLYEAERHFGVEFMEEKIAGRGNTASAP